MKSSTKIIAFFMLSLFSTNLIINGAPRSRPVEQCPDCTRKPKNQGTDATQEVNQLAQSLQTIAHTNPSPCSCINGGACSCPQGQCHCSPGSNQCPNQPNNSDDKLDQVALTNFAHMVQSFFNIVANPHNVHVVGTSIAQMVAGIINVAKEVMSRMPDSVSLEERELYIEDLETELRNGVRSMARAKKQLKLEEIA